MNYNDYGKEVVSIVNSLNQNRFKTYPSINHEGLMLETINVTNVRDLPKYTIEYTFGSDREDFVKILESLGFAESNNTMNKKIDSGTITVKVSSNESTITFSKDPMIKEAKVSKTEYMKVISEHFDMNHDETRKVLINLNEADQNKALYSLTNRLYEHIVDKVDDIDFGDIPATKGDITKLPSYDKLRDCLTIMKDILTEYKQDTKPVDIIEEALLNLGSRKTKFETAFRYNLQLPMLMYSTMYLACISATSFMISCCVDFIKQPTFDSFKIVVDRVGLSKTKDNLMFTNLEKWNEACRRGQVDNSIDFVLKNHSKNLVGYEIGMMAGGVAFIGLIMCIIPILRELIYFFYFTRVRVSDYFDAQATLLQMNAHNVQLDETRDKEEIDKIYKKQMKVSDFFRKISNTLMIDLKKAEKESSKELVMDNNKLKADEVFDELPDSGASALF